MRVTAKGQVTIPVEIQRKLNITPGSEVDFVLAEDGKVYLLGVKELVRNRDRFAKLRGIATIQMSTEEIMALTRST